MLGRPWQRLAHIKVLKFRFACLIKKCFTHNQADWMTDRRTDKQWLRSGNKLIIYAFTYCWLQTIMIACNFVGVIIGKATPWVLIFFRSVIWKKFLYLLAVTPLGASQGYWGKGQPSTFILILTGNFYWERFFSMGDFSWEGKGILS